MTLLGLLARQVAMSLEGVRVFDDAANLLAAALGELGQGEVGDALAAAAASAKGNRRDLAELAIAFGRLRALDADLASLATETVERFAVIAANRQPW
jgi:hypothetical protein